MKKYLNFINEEVSEEVLNFRRAMGDYNDERDGFDDNHFRENNDDEYYDNWDTFKKEKILYLFHSTEKNLLPTIIRNGLNGKIYLSVSPEEVLEIHPVLLRIDVTNMELEREGVYFITHNVAPNRIEVIGKIEDYRDYYVN
jgi:hypothetical protein